MKILKKILVLFVLFGLPGLSWYFLQTGLEWRKDIEIELKSKGSINELLNGNQVQAINLESVLKSKTSVLKLSVEGVSDLDKSIITQFQKSPTFQWIDFSDSEYGKSNKKVKHLNSTPVSLISGAASYMLIDTALHVRRIYPANDNAALTQLVEDMAVILPREMPKDIEMKKVSQ